MMRLTSERQSIHDAFATNLLGPADNIGGGGGKWNSNKWLAQAGTAGLVIRAVMNQPATLRGTAIFLNAPESTITPSDMIALKSGLWTRFLTKHKAELVHQGILVAYIDRIMVGYRSRVRNPKASAHTAGEMFAKYAGRQTLTEHANHLLDILQRFDANSLVPVKIAIDAELDAEEAEDELHAEKRRRIYERMRTGLTFKQAKLVIESEDVKVLKRQTA